jgi:hypothetical protein
LLLSALPLLAAACYQPSPPRPTATAAPLSGEFDRWRQEARGILSDALETLRTFDQFQAFRASISQQQATMLWDAPTSAAWDEATHVTRGLHGRADQLLQAVTTAQLDPSLWREQRAAADAVHDLLDLSEPLADYRSRIDVLPPGDASSALVLLDKAWTQWDTAAARWAISRGEPIGCGSS